MTNFEIDQTWIFTFSFGHTHPNCYVKIKGTRESSRAAMIRAFGDLWAFQYPSEAAAGVAEFNLREIKI